jgi:hypothetical protein
MLEHWQATVGTDSDINKDSELGDIEYDTATSKPHYS